MRTLKPFKAIMYGQNAHSLNRSSPPGEGSDLSPPYIFLFFFPWVKLYQTQTHKQLCPLWCLWSLMVQTVNRLPSFREGASSNLSELLTKLFFFSLPILYSIYYIVYIILYMSVSVSPPFSPVFIFPFGKLCFYSKLYKSVQCHLVWWYSAAHSLTHGGRG